MTKTPVLMAFGTVSITGTFFGLDAQAAFLATITSIIFMGINPPRSTISGVSEALISGITAGAIAPLLSDMLAYPLMRKSTNNHDDIQEYLLVIISVTIGMSFKYFIPLLIVKLPDIINRIISKFFGG